MRALDIDETEKRYFCVRIKFMTNYFRSFC